MNTQTRSAGSPVPILADHRTDKRLGRWTTRRDFEIRSRHGRVVLDLRSPQIPEGDIQITTDLDRAAVTLLVAEDAVIDQRDVTWTVAGRSSRPSTTRRPAPAARFGLPGTSAAARSGYTAAGSPSYQRSARGSSSPTRAAPTPTAA